MPLTRNFVVCCVAAAAAIVGASSFAQPNEAPMNIPQQPQRPPPPVLQNAPQMDGRDRESLRQARQMIRESGERIDRLRRELDELRDMEARMSRDGRVDRREREVLTRRVEALHRHLRREIRD